MPSQIETNKLSRLVVARIGAPQGLKGEVRVQSFTQDPAKLIDYSPLQTPDGKNLTIISMRPAKNIFVVRFDEITDRNAAEALKGIELTIERSALDERELDDEEFYVADLLGLEVRDIENTKLGTICSVENYGAGDVLEIQPVSGKRYMLAFNQRNVPQINMSERFIIVDLPQELDAKGENSESLKS